MPVSAQPYAPTLSASGSSPGSSSEPFDYSTAIDPALDGGGNAQMAIPAAPFDGASDFKPGLENASSFPPSASDQQNHKGESPVSLVQS